MSSSNRSNMQISGDIFIAMGGIESLLHKDDICQILATESPLLLEALKNINKRYQTLAGYTRTVKTANTPETTKFALTLLNDVKKQTEKFKKILKEEMPYLLEERKKAPLKVIHKISQEIRARKVDFSASNLPSALRKTLASECDQTCQQLEAISGQLSQGDIIKKQPDDKQEQDIDTYVNGLKNLVEIAGQFIHHAKYKIEHANFEDQGLEEEKALNKAIFREFYTAIGNVGNPGQLSFKIAFHLDNLPNFKHRFGIENMANLGLTETDIVNLNLTKKDLQKLRLSVEDIAELKLEDYKIARLKFSEEEILKYRLLSVDIRALKNVKKKLAEQLKWSEKDIEDFDLSSEDVEELKLSVEYVDNLKVTQKNLRLLTLTAEDVENLRLTKNNIRMLKLSIADINNALNLDDLHAILENKRKNFDAFWKGNARAKTSLDMLSQKMQSYQDLSNSGGSCFNVYTRAFQTVEGRRRQASAPVAAVNTMLLIAETKLKEYENNLPGTEIVSLLTSLRKHLILEKNAYLQVDGEVYNAPYETHRGRDNDIQVPDPASPTGTRSVPCHLSPQAFDIKFSQRIMNISKQLITREKFNAIAESHDASVSGWLTWFLFKIQSLLKSTLTCFCFGSGYAPTMFAAEPAKVLSDIQEQAEGLRRVAAKTG